MTYVKNTLKLLLNLLVSILFLSQTVFADPPARVARLSFINGDVIFSPAGEKQWVKANLNRPLIVGDRLWTYEGARTQLQLGSASFFVDGQSSISILNLNEKISQFKLTQGRINFVVRGVTSRPIEVDTPNLALVVNTPGSYSISVDPRTNSTAVSVFKGKAVVYGKKAAYRINDKRSYRFTGVDLRSQSIKRVDDNFDRWYQERTSRKLTTVRYVSPEVIGYEDLEDHGVWVNNKRYGYIWQPKVAANWVPYRDGHWAWIEPWGWTWVDNQPWGFAPFHYGRWTYVTNRWYWVPGPRRANPVYAPALVAFVGTSRAQLTLSTGGIGIAWFPLGPGDVYRPAYSVSRDYFMRVNSSNTIVKQKTILTQVYSQPTLPLTYANQQIANSVTAVPSKVFVQAQPVAAAAVAVPPTSITQTQVSAAAPVAPTAVSVAGSEKTVEKPPVKAEEPVVVQNPPAQEPISFEKKEPMLAKDPGIPLDEKQLTALQPEKPAVVETVKVEPEVKPVEIPSVTEAPKTEEPKAEEPKKAPKPEEPAPQAPTPEMPAPEKPQPEMPKPEEPKPEVPKPQEPQPEVPKVPEELPKAPKPETQEPSVIEAPKGNAAEERFKEPPAVDQRAIPGEPETQPESEGFKQRPENKMTPSEPEAGEVPVERTIPGPPEPNPNEGFKRDIAPSKPEAAEPPPRAAEPIDIPEPPVHKPEPAPMPTPKPAPMPEPKPAPAPTPTPAPMPEPKPIMPTPEPPKPAPEPPPMPAPPPVPVPEAPQAPPTPAPEPPVMPSPDGAPNPGNVPSVQ
ncbi:DUF6600 domain-containing protein [Candidatus Berkiella aquae]|uniref:FecR domain-containing protein n=1 Tax=Candidatus Berkiella aquae TaxID=295108 RepID=A0A0Q9YXX9_9GAMM|nr:DUF6600 domain-containing protein [Candidatus Berkiella aquae]MCS5710465.1 FecR domain-containing protein [Candidatus Berkiella aquae]